MQVLYPKTRTLRKLFRSERTDTGNMLAVGDGYEELYYETSIDIEALHSIARNAARNVSGKSKAGAIAVKILSRRRLPNDVQAM